MRRDDFDPDPGVTHPMPGSSRSSLVCMVFSILLTAAASAQATGRPASRDAAKQTAVRAILQSICATPRTPHVNSHRLPALRLTRFGGRNQRGYLSLVQPLRCGLGEDLRATLDRAAAREVAERLAPIYGVRVRRDAAVDVSGFEVALFLADRARKIGFALTTSRKPHPFSEPSKTDEPRAIGMLGSGAAADLRRHGWRLHHVDVEHFRAPQADTLSPQLAYALSVVAFLEEHGDGIGFDLSAFVGKDPRRLPIRDRDTKLTGVSDVARDSNQLAFTVATKGALLRFPASVRDRAGQVAPAFRAGRVRDATRVRPRRAIRDSRRTSRRPILSRRHHRDPPGTDEVG